LSSYFRLKQSLKSQVSSLKSQVSRLVLCLVVSFSTFFVSCHSEDAIFQQPDLATKPISIVEAKTWFQQQQLGNANANPTDDSLLILPSANPDWDSAFNSLNVRNHDFVIAPLDKSGANGRLKTRLLITRKSDGSLMGSKMLYIADQVYHDRKNGQYNTTDFTGNVIYSDLNGRFLFGLRVENGIEVCAASAALSTNAAQQVTSNSDVRLRECEKFTSPVIEICHDRGQVFTQDCHNFTITLYWCVASDLTSRNSGIEPGTLIGNSAGNNAGNTNVNWGAWQPASLFNAQQLNQIRTEFYANGLEGMFELWKTTNQGELSKAYNFLRRNNYNPTVVATVIKYFDAGYGFTKFQNIYSNAPLFSQIDTYLERNSNSSQAWENVNEISSEYERENNVLDATFAQDAELHLKLLEQSSEYTEFSNTLNGLSSSGGGGNDPLKGVIIDLMVDAAQEWAENFLGIPDLQELRGLLERGIESTSKVAFKATRIIARFIAKKNPLFNALSSFWKTKELYEKVNKAYQAFEKIKDIGGDIVGKIATVLKSRTGNILKNIEWIGGNDGGKIKGVDALDMFDDLKRAYGGTSRAGNTNEIIFDIYTGGRQIECKLYINSNTPRGSATISFKITGGTPNGLTVKFGFD
jgi:hypothetical protein